VSELRIIYFGEILSRVESLSLLGPCFRLFQWHLSAL